MRPHSARLTLALKRGTHGWTSGRFARLQFNQPPQNPLGEEARLFRQNNNKFMRSGVSYTLFQQGSTTYASMKQWKRPGTATESALLSSCGAASSDSSAGRRQTHQISEPWLSEICSDSGDQAGRERNPQSHLFTMNCASVICFLRPSAQR